MLILPKLRGRLIVGGLRTHMFVVTHLRKWQSRLEHRANAHNARTLSKSPKSSPTTANFPSAVILNFDKQENSRSRCLS